MLQVKQKPTLAGGNPVRKKFLVFGKPHIGKEEIKEVVATLKSGWWGTGPRAEKFEKDFAAYSEAKYALAVNSATAGLHLALMSLNLKSSDEVITTPLTFCSTVNVIIHAGATPVFADVNLDDWNIDPTEIEKKITKKTRALLPVHLHGRPCQMDKIMKIAKKHNLVVIEDAAHAAEAWYHDQKVGSIGNISVFSFYVTKNIATGEGGMITTDDKKRIEKMRILSLHGLSLDAYKRYSVREYHHYECIVPGFKYNMTDIAAAIGIHQLKRVEANAKIRQVYWDMYNTAFKDTPELITPAKEETDTRHAKHLYAILIRPEKLKITRNQFVDALIKENIGSGVHFNPIHLYDYYRKTFGFKKGDYPNAEFVGLRTISLPLSAATSARDIKDVIAAVKKIINYYKK
jgi:dTDP-4-amino-4,6-dideoxygalactose transaminase